MQRRTYTRDQTIQFILTAPDSYNAKKIEILEELYNKMDRLESQLYDEYAESLPSVSSTPTSYYHHHHNSHPMHMPPPPPVPVPYYHHHHGHPIKTKFQPTASRALLVTPTHYARDYYYQQQKKSPLAFNPMHRHAKAHIMNRDKNNRKIYFNKEEKKQERKEEKKGETQEAADKTKKCNDNDNKNDNDDDDDVDNISVVDDDK